MNTIEVIAPAKINLTLAITGVLSNGYHTVETFMQPIDLSDTIQLERNDSGKIQLQCNVSHIPLDEKNLCWKAAQLFYQKANTLSKGLLISLGKKIPDQAGLGGGSADAAAVLRGCNDLYGNPFSLEELEKMALPLGADVPFCVQNKPVFATGIGENFFASKSLPCCAIVLIKPSFGVSTQKAYDAYDRKGASRHLDQSAMRTALESQDLKKIGCCLDNVFESLLEELDKEIIQQIKEDLIYEGAVGTAMSGSGTAVFGLFETHDEAISFVRTYEQKQESLYGQAKMFITKPYNRSNIKII